MEYNLNLKTAPIIEPLSLSEVKDFLKISDIDNQCGGLVSEECILVDSRSTGVVNGNSIDVLGYIATIELNAGEIIATGKLDVKVQESSNGSSWVDVYSFAQITPSNDNQTYLYKYTGDKQYVRCVATLTIAGGDYGINIILSQGYTDEDVYISNLIKLSRLHCEKFLNRKLITQVWEMSFNNFDDYAISIPFGNLQDIDSIKYTDSDNIEHVLTENTDYIYSSKGILGKICPAYNKTWPVFTPYPLDAVVIEFTCGYGDLASDVPLQIKHAMLLLINHWFSNRIAVDNALGNAKEVEFTVSNLLWDERIVVL